MNKKQLEANLWAAADNLHANGDPKSSEFATPVLGLIFLRFSDNNCSRAEKTIEEYETMVLNARDSAAFFNALDMPVRFSRKLVAALKEHDQRVSSK